ncbi:MAG: ABC transporter ATP-binding protein [Bacteroidetes bacterium]|nr:ABC transporter ATP-binding protein [Bacteroidota bacterium]
MKLLLHYLSKYRGLVIITFVLAAINQTFSMLDPVIFGKVIDLVGKNSQKPVDDFTRNALLLILGSISVAMVSRIAKAFQDYTTNLVIQRFGADVYTDGLKHSLQLPYQDFEDKQSGSTLNILQRLRTDSEKFILSFVNVVFMGIVGIVFVVVVSFLIYGYMVIVYVIASTILYFSIRFLSQKIKEVQATIVRETNVLAGATTESLRNIELIKSLGLTNQEVQRLNTATYRILKLELKKVRNLRSISFVQGTLVNFLRQCILFVVLYAAFRGHISVGTVVTFQFFSFFIFNPLQEMGNALLSYREAEASLNNFQTILDSPLEPRAASPVAVSHVDQLKFEGVAFQHKTAKKPAVQGINFEVSSGETIAFVGPSGSGKTTLVKLLVGLYRPHQGHIRYNGIDSTQVDIDQLRNQIGFVTQDTQLFAGTIRENLLFVKPDATDEMLLDVLAKASCVGLLARADNGLDTFIGEGGMRVSGGEKQRLSIARALLRDPSLLVFDEATSALDSITEEEITRTIRTISGTRSRITVLIAHRLSTIMHADRIYVLERGRIIETGAHHDLLADKGLYYAMWRQQIGERQEEEALHEA